MSEKTFSSGINPRTAGFVTKAPAKPAPDLRAQSIEEAHKEGLLVAHMLEFRSREVDCPQMKDMCDVMANKQGAKHKGYSGNSYVSTPDGMRGMATTLLAKNMMGSLWTNTSKVGLLFDGRENENIKLEYFFPYDAYSESVDGHMTYSMPATPEKLGDILYPIVSQQHKNAVLKTNSEGKNVLHINLNEGNAAERTELAKKASKEFWQARKEGKLPHYENISCTISPESYRYMNETTISAKLAGIKGIVIASPPHLLAQPEDFRKAADMANWLSKTYPDIITSPPPILVYDGLELVEPQTYKTKMFAELQRSDEIQSTR